MSNTRRALLLLALALYSVTVFTIDLVLPVGIEVWVLHVPVLLMPACFRSRRLVVVAVLACSVAVVVGSPFSPPGSNPPWWDALNRGMGIAIMWLIAAMTVTIINRANQLDGAISSLQREIARNEQTSRTLEQSEERLRLAVAGARMGTFDVNLQTDEVVWSKTHLRMLGHEMASGTETSAEMWRSCVHPDDQKRIQEARDQALRNHSPYAAEYRIKRADDGKIVWLAVFGRYYYNEAGEAVRFLGVSFDITRRKKLERAMQRKQLERAIQKNTAREQRRIGQELHDGAGQEITGLGLMAQTLTQRLPDTSAEQRIAVRLVAGLNQLHQEIRVLAHGLIPVPMEAKGLWAALAELATRTSQQAAIPVQFEGPEWIELSDHASSVQLYRIAQEAVNNALRHGRPRRVHLSLRSQPNGLRLRIQDDGVGIPDQPKESKGLGIRIMKYRAGLIGGVLRIKRAKEGGTVVTVTLPWRKANDHEATGSGAGATENPDCG